MLIWFFLFECAKNTFVRNKIGKKSPSSLKKHSHKVITLAQTKTVNDNLLQKVCRHIIRYFEKSNTTVFFKIFNRNESQSSLPTKEIARLSQCFLYSRSVWLNSSESSPSTFLSFPKLFEAEIFGYTRLHPAYFLGFFAWYISSVFPTHFQWGQCLANLPATVKIAKINFRKNFWWNLTLWRCTILL